MAPIFGFSAFNNGHNIGNSDSSARQQPSLVGRDRNGLSKAERLLGVSEGLPPASSPTGHLDLRPKGRKIKKMSSNMSLLTDLKNVISGSTTRAAPRAGASALPTTRVRPEALKLDTDQRSLGSAENGEERRPVSAGTVPSYYYKDSPTHAVPSDSPASPKVPMSSLSRIGRYTDEEQDKILNNLKTNGMMPPEKSSHHPRTAKRPHTAKGPNGNKRSPKHSRDGSGVSKSSGNRTVESSGSMTAQQVRPSEEAGPTSQQNAGDGGIEASAGREPRRQSGRKSSTILDSQMQIPGVRISQAESSEGERVRTWLTYSGSSANHPENLQADWLVAPHMSALFSDHSSASVHTLTSLETGTIFPIQGGPGDWSSIGSPGPRGSLLVDASAVNSKEKKSSTGKSGRVYYTNLQLESVLALSDSDPDSDSDSESALYLKRMSMISNGNETQPTAWSSNASSRSHSRKISATTASTKRVSSSSDQWNYPMPNAHFVQLSREPSGASISSIEAPRHLLKPAVQNQASAMRPVEDELPQCPPPPPPSSEYNLPSLPRDEGLSSAPILGTPNTTPKLLIPTITAPEETSNPLAKTMRTDGWMRKNSTSSQSTTYSAWYQLNSPLAGSATYPAPNKPLPTPPVQTPTLQTPTVQTPNADDDASSVFSFPKPPRQPPSLNRSRTRSADLLSSPADSTAPASFNGTSSPGDSTDSNETVKPAPSPPATSRRNSDSTEPEQQMPQNVNTHEHQGPSGFLSPNSAAGASQLVLEEFSPIRIAFPEHIQRQMLDSDDKGLTDSPRASLRIDTPANVDVHVHSHTGTTPGTGVETQRQLRLEIEAPQNSQEPALRSAPPMTIQTDLSPLVPSPSIEHEQIRTAPPTMLTHGEKEALVVATASRIPVPAIPECTAPRVASSNPTRRFHLPTTSTGSTLTTRSAPSPKAAQHEVFDSKPSSFREVVRTGSEGGKRRLAAAKRAAEKKALEPLRLSKIGNAV